MELPVPVTVLIGAGYFFEISYEKSCFPLCFSPGRVVQSVGHLTHKYRTRSGNILSFLLPLFHEGQLSVTGESMCTKYWLTA